MPEEALSESQVESLLAAMEESGGLTPSAGPPPAAKPAAKPSDGGAGKNNPLLGGNVRVSPYDFKRPERVGKEQMRAIRGMHENIARNFGASISALVHAIPEVKLISVDQLTYSEFVFSLDNPSCFTVLSIVPLETHWILDFSPSLSFAMIDRMLGGDATPDSIVRRPMTEIETRLMSRVLEHFVKLLRESWINISEIEPAIDRIESNPQMVQIVPPNEVVILLGFEVIMGKNRGMMHLCIPFNGIEQFNGQLSQNSWASSNRVQSTDQTKNQITGSMSEALVNVHVTLAKSRIRTADLLELSVGDIIATEKEVSTPLELNVQDVPKYNVRAGSFKGKKAIRIESVIQTPK